MYPGTQERMSDSVVASTTSLTVTTDQVRFTGTTAIATIAPPLNSNAWGTVIFAIPVDGTIATTTAGNISKVVSMVVNQVTILVWNPTLAKWVPGAIS
jgi:hypothetical protein